MFVKEITIQDRIPPVNTSSFLGEKIDIGSYYTHNTQTNTSFLAHGLTS
jgi:hypothetical protein